MSSFRLPCLLLAAHLGVAAAPAAATDCPALRDQFEQAVAEGNAKASLAAGDQLFSRCPITDADWQALSLRYAAALARSGRTADALGLVSRCISRQPDAAQCAWEKAVLLGKLGRPAEAQRALEVARGLGAGPGTVTAPSSLQRPPSPAPSPRPGGGGKAGSGFFVNDAGVVVTNAHVVSGCRQLTTPAGEKLRLILADPLVDLALLQAAAPGPASASFRAAPPPRIGEDVLAFGYPLPGLLSSEGNVTTGILSASLGLADDPHQLQMTAPVQSGNSGGPLVDASGNVIGVVVAKLDAGRVAAQTGDVPQNVNFAIKANVISNFLETNGMKFEQSTKAKVMEIADIGERAKSFTFMLTCGR